MQEELIKLETAKIAKEKGFDIKVKNWYDQTETLNPCKGIRGAMCYENVGYAPTQSLLQKWLREVHNIEAVSFRNGGGYSTEYDYSKNFKVCKSSLYVKYKTYEQALEVGLQEALKLIPDKS